MCKYIPIWIYMTYTLYASTIYRNICGTSSYINHQPMEIFNFVLYYIGFSWNRVNTFFDWASIRGLRGFLRFFLLATITCLGWAVAWSNWELVLSLMDASGHLAPRARARPRLMEILGSQWLQFSLDKSSFCWSIFGPNLNQITD